MLNNTLNISKSDFTKLADIKSNSDENLFKLISIEIAINVDDKNISKSEEVDKNDVQEYLFLFFAFLRDIILQATNALLFMSGPST